MNTRPPFRELVHLERRIQESDVRLAHAAAALAQLREMQLPVEAATKAVTLLEEALAALHDYRTVLLDVIRHANSN